MVTQSQPVTVKTHTAYPYRIASYYLVGLICANAGNWFLTWLNESDPLGALFFTPIISGIIAALWLMTRSGWYSLIICCIATVSALGYNALPEDVRYYPEILLSIFTQLLLMSNLDLQTIEKVLPLATSIAGYLILVLIANILMLYYSTVVAFIICLLYWTKVATKTVTEKGGYWWPIKRK
jgi:hypothetical protein